VKDPGKDHRNPGLGSWNWSVRAPMSRWLEAEGQMSAGKRVLDVGCGIKPYLPYFAGAAEYIGVDVADNPSADLQGSAEALPVGDASFDLVLCLQVLEHVEDPSQVIRELHRVTRPGGRVLAATHGTQVYHPLPEDHWRWTHTGLERLFNGNGEWRSVTVIPGAGTCACLGMLLATYIDLIAQRLHIVWAGRLLNAVVNRVAGAIDARSRMLREPIPGSLFANFHVVAEK
jgi:SAM-dependent methyltransferase